MRAQECLARENEVVFDTDSSPIGIDNRCTGCISHRIEDFVVPLVSTDRTIKGYGGMQMSGIQIGTIEWSWLDDDGARHTFKIPNSFFVPKGGLRLLSPQHWAQSQRGFKPITGTGSETTHKDITLF